jgi:hypothetical protein
MQNYSQVFADTIAEFQSPYVAGDQGDNGKGQVTARAAYKIFTTMNANVGHIGKNPGQTQYPNPSIDGLRGIAVDALTDKADGTGADFLTDVLQADGRRLIAVAYTPYAPPPVGSDPAAGWVAPSTTYRDLPGPLTLKVPDVPPGPTPVPPTDDVMTALNTIIATQLVHTDLLHQVQAQQANDTAAVLTAIADVKTYIHDLVEDLEDWAKKAGLALLIRRRRQPEEP